jgi:hypothetical protein
MNRTTTTHHIGVLAGGMDWWAEVSFTSNGEDETLEVDWVQADCGAEAQATIECEGLDQLGAKVGEVWKSFRELAELEADRKIDKIRAEHAAEIQDYIDDARYEAKRDREMDI